MNEYIREINRQIIDESFDEIKSLKHNYINDRKHTVILTGEEWDFIALMVHNMKDKNLIAKKLTEIFELDAIGLCHIEIMNTDLENEYVKS
jgi:hypothetical protein